MDEDSVWNDALIVLERFGAHQMPFIWLWRDYNDGKIVVDGLIENDKYTEMLISVNLPLEHVVPTPRFGLAKRIKTNLTPVYQADFPEDKERPTVRYFRPGKWIDYLHGKADVVRAEDTEAMALDRKPFDDSGLFGE